MGRNFRTWYRGTLTIQGQYWQTCYRVYYDLSHRSVSLPKKLWTIHSSETRHNLLKRLELPHVTLYSKVVVRRKQAKPSITKLKASKPADKAEACCGDEACLV
jgi:hypothetical protein